MAPVQPAASVAATGLGIRYIGEHAYALSGAQVDGGTGGPNTTLLDFTTGSGYIKGKIDFSNESSGGADIYFRVTFNGAQAVNLKEGSATIVPMRFDILIPPRTHVVVSWGAASSFSGNCFLSGRVYGTEE